jgi:hypothetical protein
VHPELRLGFTALVAFSLAGSHRPSSTQANAPAPRRQPFQEPTQPLNRLNFQSHPTAVTVLHVLSDAMTRVLPWRGRVRVPLLV